VTSLRSELQARVDIAERNDGDIFVSIHSNSNNDPSFHGAMTFYGGERSEELAETIQKNLVYRTKAEDKGIQMAGFYVIRNTSMPSVLVEMGFVSNPKADAAFTQEYIKKTLRGAGYSVNVNLMTNREKFIERMDSLNEHADSLREGIAFKPDSRYPDYNREEVIWTILTEISL
jgi:N-acetylmuramoyl-L-alanine amidase